MLPVAKWIEEELAKMDGIEKFSRAGSIRRIREMIKDLDFVIACENVHQVKKQLLSLPNMKRVTNHGDTKISCIFSFEWMDVPVDFRLVPPACFATALHHFTGSKEHHVRMRKWRKNATKRLVNTG